jgi:hypothetical protein
MTDRGKRGHNAKGERMGEHYLVEAALENVEAVVDAATNDEVLKNIPVIGTAVKLCKAGDDIRNRIFAAKITRFLQTLNKTPPEAREKIAQKVASSPDEAKKVGETLLLVLERITALEKAEIVAYLFIAYIFEQLTEDEFRRLSDAVDQAFIDDLVKFLAIRRVPRVGREPFLTYLSHTGLTIAVGGKTYKDIGNILYYVTDLGTRLIDAYLHGIKYCRDKTHASD